MSYTTTVLEDVDAIFSILHEDFDLETEDDEANAGELAILEASSKPLSLILKFEVKLSLSDIILGASNVARNGDAHWHHRNVKHICLVTDDRAVQLAAKGMSTEAFGKLDIRIFDSVESAIAYVKEN